MADAGTTPVPEMTADQAEQHLTDLLGELSDDDIRTLAEMAERMCEEAGHGQY